jgi:hypothetical protein
VLLCVVGVAFFALEALFGTSKVCSDEAVVKVVVSYISGSVLVALCDPVYLVVIAYT